MVNSEDPYKFETQFSIQRIGKEGKFRKRLEFDGVIDLGESEGALIVQNMNFDEMKGIIYSKVFEEIEKRLKPSGIFRPLGDIPRSLAE